MITMLDYLRIAGRAFAKTCWLLWISVLIGLFSFGGLGLLSPVINEPCRQPPATHHEIDISGLMQMASQMFDRLTGQEPRPWPVEDMSLPVCERDPFGVELAGLGGIGIGLVALVLMGIHAGKPGSALWRDLSPFPQKHPTKTA